MPNFQINICQKTAISSQIAIFANKFDTWMKQYKVLFWDFDRTIWDVEHNQKEAMRELFGRFEMGRHYSDFEAFFAEYSIVNARLWDDYRDGLVSREVLRNERFNHLLQVAGIDDQPLARCMSDTYLSIVPSFNLLIPGAREVLEYLRGKYPMYLITNGFNEVQFTKVKNSGFEGYFEDIITSEMAGVNKPYAGIFEYALRRADARAEQCVMIGDDIYNDIYGAIQVGIDTIYFNPFDAQTDLVPTHTVNSLLEIKSLL